MKILDFSELIKEYEAKNEETVEVEEKDNEIVAEEDNPNVEFNNKPAEAVQHQETNIKEVREFEMERFNTICDYIQLLDYDVKASNDDHIKDLYSNIKNQIDNLYDQSFYLNSDDDLNWWSVALDDLTTDVYELYDEIEDLKSDCIDSDAKVAFSDKKAKANKQKKNEIKEVTPKEVKAEPAVKETTTVQSNHVNQNNVPFTNLQSNYVPETTTTKAFGNLEAQVKQDYTQPTATPQKKKLFSGLMKENNKPSEDQLVNYAKQQLNDLSKHLNQSIQQQMTKQQPFTAQQSNVAAQPSTATEPKKKEPKKYNSILEVTFDKGEEAPHYLKRFKAAFENLPKKVQEKEQKIYDAMFLLINQFNAMLNQAMGYVNSLSNQLNNLAPEVNYYRQMAAQQQAMQQQLRDTTLITPGVGVNYSVC